MIIVAFDLETTGVNLQIDQPIEVGLILYSTGEERILETSTCLVKSTIPISEEIYSLTGIGTAAIQQYGYESNEALTNLLETFNKADAVLGHNVLRFDRPILENWCKREQRLLPEKLWIDTRTDLPGVESKPLIYMAADHGILNPCSHSALGDCQTCLELLMKYDPEQVAERARSQTVVLVGQQDRSDNNLAKKRKFAWNPDYHIWWKVVKSVDAEQEIAACNFPVKFAPPEVLIEKLWYS